MFLNRSKGFAELAADLLRHFAQRAEDGIFVGCFGGGCGERFPGVAIDRVQYQIIGTADLGNGAVEYGGGLRALAELPGKIVRQPRRRGLVHQFQGLVDLLVGKNREVGGLGELGCEALAQRIIEHSIACCVRKIREHDRAFAGQFWCAMHEEICTGG